MSLNSEAKVRGRTLFAILRDACRDAWVAHVGHPFVQRLGDGTLPENFTFIFDNGRVRIVSVEKAVAWWKDRLRNN